MSHFNELLRQKEIINLRENAQYSWREELAEGKKEEEGDHPYVEVMPKEKDPNAVIADKAKKKKEEVKEGFRLSLKPNTAFRLDELYKGKHGQTEKEYQDSRSDAGKMISGDSKGSGANYAYKAKNTGPNPAGGKERPQGQARMSSKDREYLKYRKATLKKEELSIDDQMRISKEFNRKSPEERKKEVQAIMDKQYGKNRKEPKKDTRTDAQKMTDATGPRPGSHYRGD